MFRNFVKGHDLYLPVRSGSKIIVPRIIVSRSPFFIGRLVQFLIEGVCLSGLMGMSTGTSGYQSAKRECLLYL